jgi:hypothetical protein
MSTTLADSLATSLATTRLTTGYETDVTSNASSVNLSEVIVPDSGAMLVQAMDQHKHFPFKLYAMLEYLSKSEHSSALHWANNGLAFVIIQQDVIVEHVLPLFFNQTKFRSFVSSSRILASVCILHLKFDHGDSDFEFDMPTNEHFQQTRQLNLWGFQRLTLTGKIKHLWYHPHFIRGSVDGLKHIQRVETSETPKKGSPPDRRPTFDSSDLKNVAAARRVIAPNFEPGPVQALDQQLPKATMPNPDAMLVQTLRKYQQLTQKIARIRDNISLIDEKKQTATQPVSPAPVPLGSIITVGQHWQSAVPGPPSSRPLEHEVGDPEQQQNAVTVFQHTFPTSVYPSPVTFVDKAPAQENPPTHSLSSSPSSPQFKVPLSNVGLCTIIDGGHAPPPANDDMDDDYKVPVQENPPSHSLSSSPSSPQFKVPLSNVGLCTIIHGGHAPPPANDEMDDDFQLLVSQILGW